MNANRAQAVFHGVNHPENTDRAGEGAGICHDVIGRCRNPVAAGSRHAAHRDHHRFACRFRRCQLFANDFRRRHAAAGAVNPQHDRFHFRIQTRFADLPRSGIAAHVAWGFLTIHDGAVRKHHGNRIALFRPFIQRVVVETGGAVVFVFFAPAELFRQRFFHFSTGA